MVAWRSMRVADGSFERLRRRIVDVIDDGCAVRAASARGVAAAGCRTRGLHHIELRYGDDDRHRRCG
jgi:hypothetical protein